MQQRKLNLSSFLQEVIFQIGLLSIVFLFYAIEKNKGVGTLNVTLEKLLFYSNYVMASLLINYLLLPKFLYQKKYGAFVLFSIIVLSLVILIEEGVLEQIFYPNTRGRYIPGLLFNLLSILPIPTILVGLKFAWDAIRQQKQLEELESAIKESELQFLKTQINPHFLFNNLNNLYSYAIEASPKTPEIILELSGVLRYMLYECKEATVPLHKEIEQLNNFINLSKLQLEDRGYVDFVVNSINTDFRIAPLILSVFIENAFKHSASSQHEDISITIQLVNLGDNKLKFICQNTYSTTTNTESLSKGIGLANVQKRLDILYPEKHELNINKTDDFYTVELTLELQKQI